jgi:hypothetical protein
MEMALRVVVTIVHTTPLPSSSIIQVSSFAIVILDLTVVKRNAVEKFASDFSSKISGLYFWRGIANFKMIKFQNVGRQK